VLNTTRARRGICVAPHHLATQAGLQVLREGGNAIEAALAMAASIAVVYPQMNSIGGDSFWLVSAPGSEPVAIDACGAAAASATLQRYREAGLDAVPWRGPLAANTVAGTLSGWNAALQISRQWGGQLPLHRLLAEAIDQARSGFAVTDSLAAMVAAKAPELQAISGFASVFMPDAKPLAAGSILRQPALAATLERLASAGLQDFYQGDLARAYAADLAQFGSPVSLHDLQTHSVQLRQALSVQLRQAKVYNFPPPTQGFASLLILALFDRLNVQQGENFAHVHGLVEATKVAFKLRDRHVGDPAYMSFDTQALLNDPVQLQQLTAGIDLESAAPWPQPPSGGDTVWLGAIDDQGRSVSLIQSTYFEFGAGFISPQTGIIAQNRGASFRIAETGWNALKPGRKPFHTLNPAMAQLQDGRHMVYGTMGGEGQPQTQAAVFTRYAMFHQPLQQAVTAPRWLLGRTWGETSTSLKIETRFPAALLQQLRAAGHDLQTLSDYTDTMGHAGALVRHPSGSFEGATDPRSDGAVGAW
jgi:gamma-glutamyltranspeptidase/glutathione hydrolase